MLMAGQSNETGGLILIHTHNNLVLLEELTDVNGKLYYKSKAVFPINDPDLLNKLTDKNGQLYYDGKPIMAPVKNDKANALTLTPQGELFVDGTYFLTKQQYNVLSKFDYAAYLLTFNGKQVSLEADDTSIKNVINQVWANIDNDSNYNWLKSNQEEEAT